MAGIFSGVAGIFSGVTRGSGGSPAMPQRSIVNPLILFTFLLLMLRCGIAGRGRLPMIETGARPPADDQDRGAAACR